MILCELPGLNFKFALLAFPGSCLRPHKDNTKTKVFAFIMDQMKGFRIANKLYKKSLLNAIAGAAALSIFFFGKNVDILGLLSTS